MRPLVEIYVRCLQPVPWSAPQVFMKERKNGGPRYKSAARNPEMEFWQAYVRSHAEEAMERAGARLSVRPLYALLVFYRATADPALCGLPWFNGVEWREGKDDKPGAYVKVGETVPDLDNLSKSTLDALQGVVFGNDVQVCILEATRVYGEADGCEILISEIEPHDEI